MSSPIPPVSATLPLEAISSEDPLRLDAEQIEALAEPEVVRAGLRHSNNRSVTGLDRTEESLWAQVEDEQSGEELELEVVIRADGAVGALCACQKAGPDDTEFWPPCVHAIAALFAYKQGQGAAGQIADAAQEARAERIAKARSEVRVAPLSETAAQAGRGLWSARSIQSSTHFPARYRVHIRSLERRANHCTC